MILLVPPLPNVFTNIQELRNRTSTTAIQSIPTRITFTCISSYKEVKSPGMRSPKDMS